MGHLVKQNQVPDLSWSGDSKATRHLWYCVLHQSGWNVNIIKYTLYTQYIKVYLSKINKSKELGIYKTISYYIWLFYGWKELPYHFPCYNSGFDDDEMILSRWTTKFIHCNDFMNYDHYNTPTI